MQEKFNCKQKIFEQIKKILQEKMKFNYAIKLKQAFKNTKSK